MIKKKSLCVVALIGAALPAIAGEFTYLSGGLLSNQQGFATQINNLMKDEEVVKENGSGKRISNHSFGLYLNGSFDFKNKVFVEGRAQASRKIHEYLLGVGYHYPVMQEVDIYGLAGIVARQLELSRHVETNAPIKNNEKLQEFPLHSLQYLDRWQPTLEVGAKMRVTEDAGLQAAYRWAKFGVKEYFVKTNNFMDHLHEGRIGSYYHIADNLAVEMGYRYTVSCKGSQTKDKWLEDHTLQLGVRYAF